MMEVISVCLDCMYHIEFGFGEHKAEYDAGVNRLQAKHIMLDAQEEEYFSRSACDICNCLVGGMRYDAIVEL